MGLTERTNVSLLLLHEFDGVSCTVELLFNKVLAAAMGSGMRSWRIYRALVKNYPLPIRYE